MDHPHDLWDLTFGQPWIDPMELACALERQVHPPRELDFRTRLLIRDSLDALSAHWGKERLTQWLSGRAVRHELEKIWRSELGPAGFPTLCRRLMDAIKPATIEAFLRDLGTRLPRPAKITVGGSIALILSGNLWRGTDDMDVVDEVPAELRAQHDLLERLAQRHGLRLTHFQSHFLPTGWSGRVRSLGQFGSLKVDLVDPYDIAVRKLFSAREKDLDDLRAMAATLDKGRIQGRVHESAQRLLAEPKLAENARRNWYVVYGEPMPE